MFDTPTPSPGRATVDDSPARIATPRERLLEQGYLIVPGAIPAPEIAELRRAADEIVAAQPPEYWERHKAIGSLININQHPELARLISHEAGLGLMQALGFGDPRYQYGILFNKQGPSPRSFWHQDGMLWGADAAYSAEPTEIGLLYYLQDTSTENGCLAVLPGSQLTRHAVHDYHEKVSTEESRRRADPSAIVHQELAGEVALEVKAGDVIVMDMRLLHATKANATASGRALVTCVYYPDYAELPESVRARIRPDAQNGGWRWAVEPERWPAELRERIERLLPPVYGGSVPAEPFVTSPDNRMKR